MEKPVLLSLSQCFRLQNVSHSQRQFSRTLSLAKLVMHLEPRKVALNFKCFFFFMWHQNERTFKMVLIFMAGGGLAGSD